MKKISDVQGKWHNTGELRQFAYTCGYCSAFVSSVKGYALHDRAHTRVLGGALVCPNCESLSVLYPDGTVFPGLQFGNVVNNVPDQLYNLYSEARSCTSDGCYTASVLLCRKILMNIGVEQGAAEGLSFIRYVEYLSDKGFVPPNGKHWVDHIRKKGNEATHEIVLMTADDAKDLITFIEMLLKFIYEFPKMVPVPPVSI